MTPESGITLVEVYETPKSVGFETPLEKATRVLLNQLSFGKVQIQDDAGCYGN